MPDITLYILSFRLVLMRVLINRYTTYTHYWIPFKKLVALTACLAEIELDIVLSQGAGHHGIRASRCPYPAVITIHGIQVQEAAYLSGLRRRFWTCVQGWVSNNYCIRKASHTILICSYVTYFFGAPSPGSEIRCLTQSMDFSSK
jgi:hypothetical protein